MLKKFFQSTSFLVLLLFSHFLGFLLKISLSAKLDMALHTIILQYNTIQYTTRQSTPLTMTVVKTYAKKNNGFGMLCFNHVFFHCCLKAVLNISILQTVFTFRTFEESWIAKDEITHEEGTIPNLESDIIQASLHSMFYITHLIRHTLVSFPGPSHILT